MQRGRGERSEKTRKTGLKSYRDVTALPRFADNGRDRENVVGEARFRYDISDAIQLNEGIRDTEENHAISRDRDRFQAIRRAPGFLR